MRTDGTLWYQGTDEVMLASGPALVATQFDTYYSTYTSGTNGYGLGCAVDSAGAVWCWGSNGYGQLGNPSVATSSSSPGAVQVATNSTTTTFLTNMKKVWVDGYDGDVACAINGSGAVWCWGYGYYGALGTGYTFNYAYAKPVLVSGSQMTGVDQMSVANDHVCAHKTDGTIWCWGSNSYGQIGVGTSSSSNPTYLNPVQVTSLMTAGVQVSVGQYVSCAVDTANDVWCWGYNSYGEIGQGVTTPSSYNSPQKVLAAAGGAAFGGVAQVQVGSYSYDTVCAILSADKSLWCWGSYASSSGYVPIPYTENSMAIDTVAYFGDNWSSDPSFIDYKGQFHFGGSESSSYQVTCP
jgi:alpha-tubulin suppressor-like RCC1 family protein